MRYALSRSLRRRELSLQLTRLSAGLLPNASGRSSSVSRCGHYSVWHSPKRRSIRSGQCLKLPRRNLTSSPGLQLQPPSEYHHPLDLNPDGRLPVDESLGFSTRLTSPHKDAMRIAVLGGGLTGLCTAFYLATRIPSARVTIYEKSTRVGGWLDSEIVNVGDGQVLFDWGPRTIRPDPLGAGRATLHLVCLHPTGNAPD
jgi:hypothetical protein